MVVCLIISVILIICENIYLRIACKFNIIDKPSERSSHSLIVVRGGGIIFLLGVWIWSFFIGFYYPLFLAALTLAAVISFIDDIKTLSDLTRLIVQFLAVVMLICQLLVIENILSLSQVNIYAVVVALIVCVGATNIYNFMDGINGMTAAYSLAVLLPLILVNHSNEYVYPSLLYVVLLSVLVFSFFNFRPRGKAKCFAGDVGSVSIAFILLFAIGRLIIKTCDLTWLIFLIVYGVDGCLTICHRILLHENLGMAHRKHIYQLMANELNISHLVVSCFYMLLQLMISLGFIYLIPNTTKAHWVYLFIVLSVLCIAYVIFIRKYYYLHDEYLKHLEYKSRNEN